MGSWTYSSKPIQGCTSQQNTSSGYGQNVLGTKIENGKWGKLTQVTKSFQKTFDGLPKAKTSSIHTQIVGLPSHPQNITKRDGLATQTDW